MRKLLLVTPGVAAALMLIFSTPAFPQNVVTVTDCNLNGWLKQPIGSSSLGFVTGPAIPPLGKGSMGFNIPAGGIFWPGDFVRFRNGQYSGTLLSSLTELSYSTYVEERDTIADIHFLVVLVDINGDGSAEHNLVFDPRYQNPAFIKSTMPNQGTTTEHVWQNWDALHGGWFYGGTIDTDPDHNGPFFTLAEYLILYPNATIRNDPAKGGAAIRLSAGGVVFKPNFFGSADNFRIGINGSTTIYDFEPGIANAGADKDVFYGYGSNCLALEGIAAGGVAPFSYSWSPGGSSQYENRTEVCPTTTTTYTLTITDKNGCTGTDNVTVSVNDIRCGNNRDKVKLCHNGQEICVAKESVPAHLNHGDQLGNCTSPSITKTGNRIGDNRQDQIILSNHPNPFANGTEVVYQLLFDGNVIFKIYDNVGRELNTRVVGNKKAGRHSLHLDSKGWSTGVYYYKMILMAGKNVFSQVRGMIVAK